MLDTPGVELAVGAKAEVPSQGIRYSSSFTDVIVELGGAAASTTGAGKAVEREFETSRRQRWMVDSSFTTNLRQRRQVRYPVIAGR